MPLIKVQTSVTTPEPTAVEGLLKILSSKLAQHLGKPESYVMTAFEPRVAMTFAGTVEPVCYIEIKSIGTMSPTQTKAMSGCQGYDVGLECLNLWLIFWTRSPRFARGLMFWLMNFDYCSVLSVLPYVHF